MALTSLSHAELLFRKYAAAVSQPVEPLLRQFRGWLGAPKEELLFFQNGRSIIFCTKHDSPDDVVLIRLTHDFEEAQFPFVQSAFPEVEEEEDGIEFS